MHLIKLDPKVILLLVAATWLCGGSGWTQGVEGVGGEVVANATNLTEFNMDHVTVWFDHGLRYYYSEPSSAYSNQDLSVLVEVVASRFKSVMVEPGPPLSKVPNPGDEADESFPPAMRVSPIIASFNKNKSGSGGSPQKSSLISATLAFSRVSEMETIVRWANIANSISPGTVDTLVWANFYSASTATTSDNFREFDLKGARKIMTRVRTPGSSSPPYKLGVIVDIQSCGLFGGPLGPDLANILKYVEVLVLHLQKRKTEWPGAADPRVAFQMFQTSFDECQRKLLKAKPDLIVNPLFSCGNHMETGDATTDAEEEEEEDVPTFRYLLCWKLLSDWATQRHTNVVLYEAFDAPYKASVGVERRRRLVSKGWWRLKDVGDYDISRDMFVERVQDLKGQKDGPKEDKEESSTAKNKTNSEQVAPSSSSSSCRRTSQHGISSAEAEAALALARRWRAEEESAHRNISMLVVTSILLVALSIGLFIYILYVKLPVSSSSVYH